MYKSFEQNFFAIETIDFFHKFQCADFKSAFTFIVINETDIFLLISTVFGKINYRN